MIPRPFNAIVPKKTAVALPTQPAKKKRQLQPLKTFQSSAAPPVIHLPPAAPNQQTGPTKKSLKYASDDDYGMNDYDSPTSEVGMDEYAEGDSAPTEDYDELWKAGDWRTTGKGAVNRRIVSAGHYENAESNDGFSRSHMLRNTSDKVSSNISSGSTSPETRENTLSSSGNEGEASSSSTTARIRPASSAPTVVTASPRQHGMTTGLVPSLKRSGVSFNVTGPAEGEEVNKRTRRMISTEEDDVEEERPRVGAAEHEDDHLYDSDPVRGNESDGDDEDDEMLTFAQLSARRQARGKKVERQTSTIVRLMEERGIDKFSARDHNRSGMDLGDDLERAMDIDPLEMTPIQDALVSADPDWSTEDKVVQLNDRNVVVLAKEDCMTDMCEIFGLRKEEEVNGMVTQNEPAIASEWTLFKWNERIKKAKDPEDCFEAVVPQPPRIRGTSSRRTQGSNSSSSRTPRSRPAEDLSDNDVAGDDITGDLPPRCSVCARPTADVELSVCGHKSICFTCSQEDTSLIVVCGVCGTTSNF